SFLTPRSPPPSPTLFPYTTLFRSRQRACRRGLVERHVIARQDVAPAIVRPLVEEAVRAALEDHAHLGSEHRGVALHRRERRGLRSEEHTSELPSRENLVCRLLLEK